ncbi:unnamed protein product, partial [Prorocentrum cordatum]
VLVGHIVHHCQLLRFGLSVLDKVWAFMSESGGKEVRLWASVRWELEVSSWLVFLAEARLSAEPASIAFCGDSSAVGYALHVTSVSGPEFRAVARYRERWRFDAVERSDDGWGAVGSWTAEWRASPDPAGSLGGGPRDLGGGPAVRCRPWRDIETVERPAEEVGIPPLPDALLASKRWAMVVKGAWQHDGVIHEKEGRVLLMGLVRASRCVGLHGKRVLSIGDNLSSLCSFEKGRSGSFALRRLCQRAGALSIGCELDWSLRYVESKRNPTDFDSRAADRGELAAGCSVAGRHGRAHQFVVEIFAGCAAFSAACQEADLNIGCPIEISRGPHMDVTRQRTQRHIKGLVKQGLVWYLHLGTPCTTWSRARTTGSGATTARGRTPSSTGASAWSGSVLDAELPDRDRRRAAKAASRRAAAGHDPGDRFLERKTVGKGTLVNYETCSSDFVRWASQQAPPRALAPLEQLDASLSAYFDFLFFDGCEPWAGRHTLFGYAHLHGVVAPSRNLPHAVKALAGWVKACPELSRDPCPWEVFAAIADHWLELGTTESILAAACGALQFDTHLRPAAAVSLSLEHVVLPSGRAGDRYDKVALIVAPSSGPAPRPNKNQQFDDTVMVGSIDPSRGWLRQLVRQLVARARARRTQRLFNELQLSSYERLFREASHRLGLAALKVSPHTLRHGGPSLDYLNGLATLPVLKKRGGWLSDRSVARYGKEGRLLRQISRLSPAQQQQFKRAASRLRQKLLCATG